MYVVAWKATLLSTSLSTSFYCRVKHRHAILNTEPTELRGSSLRLNGQKHNTHTVVRNNNGCWVDGLDLW